MHMANANNSHIKGVRVGVTSEARASPLFSWKFKKKFQLDEAKTTSSDHAIFIEYI